MSNMLETLKRSQNPFRGQNSMPVTMNDMKHPSEVREPVVYNLGKAQELRCVHAGQTKICGCCEGCKVRQKLLRAKGWFERAGDQTKRYFTLGLVRKIRSVDLLQYIIKMLRPLLATKDFLYARTRIKPSLTTDRATMSNDRALGVPDIETEIAETWAWFEGSNYWTKSNFMLGLLQWCDAHLLFQIGCQACTLLASEARAYQPEEDYEAASVASTKYSFDSTIHPDLDLLTTARTTYSHSSLKQDPLLGEGSTTAGSQVGDSVARGSSVEQSPQQLHSSIVNDEIEIVNDDSGDESFADDWEEDSVDPTCLVIPNSIKAHSGVAKHKDFIRFLPVHLSKYILGMLDQTTLYNALCVNRNWRALVEEVHKEFYVNQHLWEEVMLMQGSAAQGSNPNYAKDIDIAVPNIRPHSFEALRTEDEVIQTTFKSEVNFKTAYSGYSTRNVIMEERNVYCGAYNVMILRDEPDIHRVCHTDGSTMIALGSHDRKIRFISSDTGRDEDLVITGHAGSIRCVVLNEAERYVLSGSYDTSIRCWSLETGKCLRIFRGHRDTVVCMQIVGNRMASGAKDNMCKVWNLDTGKCLQTFKHRHPVLAVAFTLEMCITGCERGRVKVWDMKTSQLIKRLTGHHGPVTGIKFDKWHIITCSKDGYTLAWSSQGDHKRCLTALRHPREVLCVEFKYLRVITGCADGKLRIWNMVTGQCLRIMRGNSKSDPIVYLQAIGNRVTMNTPNNLMVLNFEHVQYDYTLDNDKMPPLVQYSKYCDAPVRQQPYSYIRAQRMNLAGATNTKIVQHAETAPESSYMFRHQKRSDQTPHSAKSLSKRSMDTARVIQKAGMESGYLSLSDFQRRLKEDEMHKASDGDAASVGKATTAPSVKSVSIYGKPPVPAAQSRAMTSKSRGAMSVRSGFTQSVVSVGGFRVGADDDSDLLEEDTGDMRRRVSWAFENPAIPKTKELALYEMKNLLRSQMRFRGEVIPPDFIYLTVNAIHTNMKPTQVQKNMEINRRSDELEKYKKSGRPTSSPGRIDPRTKVPVEELELDALIPENRAESVEILSEAESKISRISQHSKKKAQTPVIPAPVTTTYVTDFSVIPVKTPHKGIHPKQVKSSIPRGRLIRPHTASVPRHNLPQNADQEERPRPKTATGIATRPMTAMTGASTGSSVASAASRRKRPGYSTTATETNMVPMLMYPADMNNKLKELKQRRQAEEVSRVQAGVHSYGDGAQGNVSKFNDPMRSHVNFKLLTHQQVEQKIDEINRLFVQQRRKADISREKKQKAAWLAKVKGTMPA